MTFAFINNTEKNRSRQNELLHEYLPSLDGVNMKVIFRLRPFHRFKEHYGQKVSGTYYLPKIQGSIYVFKCFTREPPSFNKQCTKAIVGGKNRHDAMLIRQGSKRL